MLRGVDGRLVSSNAARQTNGASGRQFRYAPACKNERLPRQNFPPLRSVDCGHDNVFPGNGIMPNVTHSCVRNRVCRGEEYGRAKAEYVTGRKRCLPAKRFRHWLFFSGRSTDGVHFYEYFTVLHRSRPFRGKSGNRVRDPTYIKGQISSPLLSPAPSRVFWVVPSRSVSEIHIFRRGQKKFFSL